MALLIVGENRYELVGAGEATLADLIALKRQTGLGVGELQQITARFADVEDVEQFTADNPGAVDDMLIAMGITVWLTRRHAGETLTLEEACAVPLDAVKVVAEPGDKKPKKAKTPDPQ